MVNDHCFLLTGAFGSGKSILLEHLRSRGIRVIVEPARAILAEQRTIQGNGVPEKDPRLFVELMFYRMLDSYRQSEVLSGPVLFDRGIPDILGYAHLFDSLNRRAKGQTENGFSAQTECNGNVSQPDFMKVSLDSRASRIRKPGLRIPILQP